jgi:hypothetical protein
MSETRRVTLKLDRELIGKLKLAAYARDETMTAFASRALMEALEPHGTREARTSQPRPAAQPPDQTVSASV